MSVVLMYHSIFPDNDYSAIDAEDLPYAVSVSDFTRQLDLLTEKNVALFSEGKSPEVVISFDDGHASNLHLAAPLLLERGLPAYFFITSNFIGKRKHFMTADELTELSQIPGMCIGSHGMTHRFFDDMSNEESEVELLESRQALEALCGSACRSISFPGGRYLPQTLTQLTAAGYTQWFDSEIGLIDVDKLMDASMDLHTVHNAADVTTPDESLSQQQSADGNPERKDRWSLIRQCDLTPLQRVAVRRNTQIEEFSLIINQESAYFRRKHLISKIKHSARRILGNRLYHGLYKSIAAR